MTEEYQIPLPSEDRDLANIPEGNSRSKIIATIVDYTHPTIIINDGTGQLAVNIPGFIRIEFEDLQIGLSGRFIIDIDEIEGTRHVKLLGYHKMNKEQINKYKQLVKIESSQSKS